MSDTTATTQRQKRILQFISTTVKKRGYPPTVREIGEAVGLTSSSSVHAQLTNLERKGLLRKDPTKPRAMALSEPRAEAVGLTSSSSVHAQLTNLERKGLLRKDPTKPRAMALSEPRAEAVSVPLVGRIAAGSPVLAAEHVEEYVAVPEGFAEDDAAHFALTISGDSMIGAGIFDGDLVVIRQQDHAEDGDIVAALLPGPAEDEATVKRLGHDHGRVMLIPENPRLEPFEMTEGSLLGKVVAVLRKL